MCSVEIFHVQCNILCVVYKSGVLAMCSVQISIQISWVYEINGLCYCWCEDES